MCKFWLYISFINKFWNKAKNKVPNISNVYLKSATELKWILKFENPGFSCIIFELVFK